MKFLEEVKDMPNPGDVLKQAYLREGKTFAKLQYLLPFFFESLRYCNCHPDYQDEMRRYCPNRGIEVHEFKDLVYN